MTTTALIAMSLGALLASGPLAAIAADMPVAADNTAKNVRDRADDALTPMDQGGSEADRTITQQIRKAVVANDDLSVNAQNVKIITRDGTVTLRGPVKTESEKTSIALAAKSTSGVKNVDNQLQVENTVENQLQATPTK